MKRWKSQECNAGVELATAVQHIPANPKPRAMAPSQKGDIASRGISGKFRKNPGKKATVSTRDHRRHWNQYGDTKQALGTIKTCG